jgi:hypothetical protein
MHLQTSETVRICLSPSPTAVRLIETQAVEKAHLVVGTCIRATARQLLASGPTSRPIRSMRKELSRAKGPLDSRRAAAGRGDAGLWRRWRNARADDRRCPACADLYQAVDPFAGDRLGRLSLTLEG